MNHDISIGSNGKKSKRGLFLLVYGMPGTGKTFIANYFPCVDSKGNVISVLYDAEYGDSPLKDNGWKGAVIHGEFNPTREGFTALEDQFKTMTSQGIMTGHNGSKVDFKKIEHLFIDNMSEIEQSYMYSLMGARNKKFPELKEHGDVAVKMRQTLRMLKSLVTKGVNVIVFAHEHYVTRFTSDGVEVNQTLPKLGSANNGKQSIDMLGMFDMVGDIEATTDSKGKTERKIRVQPNIYTGSKNKVSGTDPTRTYISQDIYTDIFKPYYDFCAKNNKR